MSIAISQLHDTVQQVEKDIADAQDSAQLKAITKRLYADDSPITLAQRGMGTLSQEEKIEYGKALNQIKKTLKDILDNAEERISVLEQYQKLSAEKVDITLPTNRQPMGALHPTRQIIREVERIFISLGWQVQEGPEVEAEFYNFDALNFPPDHPARAMQDTFYIAPEDSGMVLRTHTSPVQLRTLLHAEPPLYMICPGRVFRTDTLDATHSPIFTQIEGLAIDTDITLAHLKGTLDYFAQELLGYEIKSRLRPHFFPFTEPSLEYDIWFENKQGGPGWIEWGGCGMVHPHVLLSAGLDPAEYQGFAFGMGLERTVMLRNGISDMRDMIEGDIRFTKPFGMGW